MTEEITKELQTVYSTLVRAGYECYLVGGAVRNYLAGKAELSDFDIATNAHPEQVMALFRRVVPTGIKHGTVTVLVCNEQFEVTTYRLDGKYSDGRRPEHITFTCGILEDLKRRDFTMNAIAYEIASNTFLDPHNGQADIQKKVIRAIGQPVERFQEDGLRSLRAIRFVSQLGFRIEPHTYRAIKQCLSVTCKVSRERIMTELLRLCTGQNAAQALVLLCQSGLAWALFPEMACCYSFVSVSQQKEFLNFFTNAFNYLDANDVELRLAAIMAFDLSYFIALCQKQPYDTQQEDRVARCMALGRKNCFSTKTLKAVTHFVRWALFPEKMPEWTDAEVRSFLRKIDIQALHRLFVLWYAAASQDKQKTQKISHMQQRILALLQQPGLALQVKDLAIDGCTLMSHFALQEGRTVGYILNHLLDKVTEDPTLNNTNTLLHLAEEIINS